MKKVKTFKPCHKCDGKGQLGVYYYGDFHVTGKCGKCNGKGYL